jgi:hypothetical protein
MTKIGKIPNKLPSDSAFWIFPILHLFWPRFVSVRGAAFEIRISDFAWRFGARRFLEVALIKR